MSQRDITTHEREQARSSHETTAQQDVREGLQFAARALESGGLDGYRDAAELLVRKHPPGVAENLRRLSGRPLPAYASVLYHSQRFNSTALHRLINNPEAVVAGLLETGLARRKARMTIEQAQESLAEIADHEGVLEGYTTDTVPASEYEHQVGVRHYRVGSPGNQPANMIDSGDDLKATLLTGGQGSGKSTALKTLVEDRIANGHKVIDLVDFHKAENATYDIPQQQSDLVDSRSDLGLDVGFEEFEAPSMEIITPLSDTLAESQVPFEGETPVVMPFAIPPSELTYRQLVMLMPHTTQTQENYLQSAHISLNKKGGDWTLRDLSDSVRHDTNAGDSIADRIEQALDRTQQKPYIRDQESEFTLDWDHIMGDPSTVSAFTVHMLAEKSDKLAVTSYLLDKLYEERQRLLHQRRLGGFPTLTAVFRELHTIVPHSKSEQDAEKTLESYMIDTFSELIALMRHANVELLADTQKFKQQLASDVSSLFHRVFAFSGQKPDIQEVFRTRVGHTDGNPAEKVTRYDTGKCALVSGDGYTMPIEFAGPRSHHPDAKQGEDGFTVREDYLDEDLKDAPWDTTIPPRLQFRKTAKSPIEKFYRDVVRVTGDPDQFVTKKRVTEAYEKWANITGEDRRTHEQIHTWLSQNTDLDGGKTRRAGPGDNQTTCWWGIEIFEAELGTGEGQEGTAIEGQ